MPTKEFLIAEHNQKVRDDKRELIEARVMKVGIAIVVSYAIIQGVIYFTR